MSITQDTLKEYLSYDKDTGEFTRITKLYNTIKLGDIVNNKVNAEGYIQIKVSGKVYLAHRLAFLYVEGEFPQEDTDHINGIRHDNRWLNLRRASRSENSCNKGIHPANTTGTRGLSYIEKENLWIGTIRKDGKRYTKANKNKQIVIDWLEVTRKQLHGEFHNDI